MSDIEKYQNTETGLATQQDFINEFSVPACMKKYRKADTIEKAVDTKAPTLGIIKKEYSEDFVLAYIEMWIVSLNDFINASRTMNETQIQETAALIFQDYGHLKLSDINLIFNKAKKGDFGKIYESLDGTKILQWFRDYTDQRMEICLSRGVHENDKIKKQAEALPRQSEKGKKEMKKVSDMVHEYKLQKVKEKYAKTDK
ncbi:MAG: DUF6633 family protein [Bacteroidota bacterium]